MLDKVLTDLAGIAPGHAATHWTNLRSSKINNNYREKEGGGERERERERERETHSWSS